MGLIGGLGFRAKKNFRDTGSLYGRFREIAKKNLAMGPNPKFKNLSLNTISNADVSIGNCLSSTRMLKRALRSSYWTIRETHPYRSIYPQAMIQRQIESTM